VLSHNHMAYFGLALRNAHHEQGRARLEARPRPLLLPLRDHAADQIECCERFAALRRAFAVAGKPVQHGPEQEIQLPVGKAC
jgi:hypothetical protein